MSDRESTSPAGITPWDNQIVRAIYRAATGFLVVSLVLIAGAQPVAAATPKAATAKPTAPLPDRLTAQLKAAGGRGSGFAVDLQTGKTIWARHPTTPRTPASLTKLFTTTTALLELGPSRRLSTSVVRATEIDPDGTLAGNLWLKGAGDPTFGPTAVAKLADAVKAAGIKRVTGSVIGDEGFFDRLRGTPILGGDYDSDIGGGLSALSFDHGDTAKAAAATLTLALRHRDISVPKGHVGVGTAPLGAEAVATSQSPSIATLIGMTNRPSDNFYAEMLLKLIGATKTGAGTTKAGLRVERTRLAQLGVNPVLNDGSGLSHDNKVRSTEVVRLLSAMSGNRYFTRSLAVAGRSGTLAGRMTRGAAAGRCSGKTGTLNGVTALAGYCPVKNGGKLAFSILMTGTSSYKGRPRQDRIVQALASWSRPTSWQR